MQLFSLATFFGHGLAILVFVVGFGFALSKLRRFPAPSILVMGGTGALLLLQVYHVVMPMLMTQFITSNQFTILYGISALVSGCVRAVAISLLVVAAFVGRQSNSRPYTAQGSNYPDENHYSPLA